MAASSTAAISSSPTALRSGMSATARERKLPYFAPVSELVLGRQPGPASDLGRIRGRDRDQRDLAGLAQRTGHPRRCRAGSVIASSANEILAISISNPAIASRSDLGGRPDYIAGSGRCFQRHRPEHRAAAVRAAVRLQAGDLRPPGAGADRVHGPAVRALVGPGDRGPVVRGVQRSVVSPGDERPGARRRAQVVQVAGAGQDTGAHVLVEVRRQRRAAPGRARRSAAGCGACLGPPGAEREEHVLPAARGQRGHRPGQEQLRPGHRVGRVGAGHVEAPDQVRGQRLAQVVPDQPQIEAARRRLRGNAVRAGPGRCPPRSAGAPAAARRPPRGKPAKRGDGQRHQVVVAQEQDPLPGQRTRLVHRAARRRDLGVRPCSASGRARAWPRARPAPPRSAQRSAQRSAPGLATPRPPQLRAPGRSARAGRRRRPRAPARGQPHRPGPVNHAALAQLVADRGDDRHGQLGQLADGADGDRLGAADGQDHVPDPGRALGQPGRGGDLSKNSVGGASDGDGPWLPEFGARGPAWPARDGGPSASPARPQTVGYPPTSCQAKRCNRAADRAAERYAELRRDEAGMPKKLYAVDGTVHARRAGLRRGQLTADRRRTAVRRGRRPRAGDQPRARSPTARSRWC